MSRFVEAGGLRWHVEQAGRGPGMLLVHGTGASMHSWRDVLPLLARDYAVLAVDLPGHGLTDQAAEPHSSIGGMSQSLAALLQVLNVSPRFCVGHSAGAVILCRMALDGHIAPQAIVSVNGAFLPFAGAAALIFPPFARLLAGSSFMSQLIARRAANPANVARVIAATGSTLDAAGVDLYVRLVSNPKHLAGTLRMMGHWDLESFERDLPRLNVFLALIVADNDLTVPPRQALIVKERVPNAVIHRLPGLGHLAHEEAPLLVARTIATICGDTPC